MSLATSSATAQTASARALDALRAKVSAPAATVRYGPSPEQRVDLRLPAGKGPFPVAILIHGGCWRAEVDDLTGLGPLADALVARGIATWNIEYRRLGNVGGGWPGTFEDIARATDQVATAARSYSLDLKRVVAVGHSAGAPLALWTAARAKQVSPLVGGKPSVRPAAVVAIDGPGGFEGLVGPDAQVCGQSVVVPLLGATPEAHPDRYRAVSATAAEPLGVRQLMVTADLAPFMTDHIERARTAGDKVTVLAPKDADHFNVLVPNDPVGAQVLDAIAALVPR